MSQSFQFVTVALSTIFQYMVKGFNIFNIFLSRWSSVDNQNGILIFEYSTSLFTDRCMKKCNVYMRKCISGDCTNHWNGSESSIFQLTKSTCAGYELGIVIYVIDKRPVFYNYVIESIHRLASNIWELVLFDTKFLEIWKLSKNDRKKKKGFK